jgi:hypothetical protein
LTEHRCSCIVLIVKRVLPEARGPRSLTSIEGFACSVLAGANNTGGPERAVRTTGSGVDSSVGGPVAERTTNRQGAKSPGYLTTETRRAQRILCTHWRASSSSQCSPCLRGSPFSWCLCAEANGRCAGCGQKNSLRNSLISGNSEWSLRVIPPPLSSSPDPRAGRRWSGTRCERFPPLADRPPGFASPGGRARGHWESRRP